MQPSPIGTAPTLASTGTGTMPTLASADAGTMPTLAPCSDYERLVEIAPEHYDVERELARGGMGRIRLARDRRLARMVALKEVLVADGELARRFEREVRITARLQHPSIVSVYEAGLWPNQAPFYAMPVVRGRSLDEVIAEKRTLAERMSLLPSALAVADALAYAHGERIIHRDLKPKNVLVGAFGETVVIDWGLAKDLAAGDAEISLSGFAAGTGIETAVGEVMGTPAYMPPEQADSAAVDERADVYAIGALLVHVLTGRPPYEGKTLVDLLDQVRNQPPASVREREPSIAPDLAAIVERAMARDPDERYPTAKELAEDLRRFQTGQLVAAHRYSLGDLVRRWVRRHRTAIAVALVAIVGIVALGAVSLQKIVHAQHVAEDQRELAEKQRAAAEQQRALAEASRADAEDLVGFMLGDLRNKIAPLGKTDILDAVATKTVAYYNRRGQDLSAAELGKRARGLMVLAHVLEDQGRVDDAILQYRAAIEIATSLVAKEPNEASWQLTLADAHAGLGNTFVELVKPKEALPELKAARSIALTLSALHPTDDTLSLGAANAAVAVGSALIAQGDPAGALVELRSALAVEAALVAKDSKSDVRQHSMWQTHLDIGDALKAMDDAAGAHKALDQALAVAVERATDTPDDATKQDDLELSLERVADLYAAEDKVQQAVPYYRRALGVSDTLVTLDPKNINWRASAADLHRRIGACLYASDPAGAIREYRLTISLAEQMRGTNPLRRGKVDDEISYVHQEIGNAFLKLRDYPHATAEYAQALAINEQLAAQEPNNAGRRADVAAAHYKLGKVLLAKGDLRGALASYRTSLEMTEQAGVANLDLVQQSGAADLHEEIGDLLLKTKDLHAALAEYHAAITLGEAVVAASPAKEKVTSYLDEYRARASAVEKRLEHAR